MPNKILVVPTPEKISPTLEKAKLVGYNNEAPTIEFMFNPTELSFTRSVDWQTQKGNRGNSLLPKTNFSGVNPYSLTLKQLLFDTYETKESVMDKYLNVIRKGVETISSGRDKRAPVYNFVWGAKPEYFYCVIKSLTYTLNMFLSDGTPVRAMVDLTLQEVDPKNMGGSSNSKSTGQARQQDSRQSRQGQGGQGQ